MKVEVYVGTDVHQSQVKRIIEVDDEDLEGLTPDQQDLVIEEQARDQMFSMIHWGWGRVEESEIPRARKIGDHAYLLEGGVDAGRKPIPKKHRGKEPG